ncbi:hypothetical protein MMC12_005425 [Toensbergia leucococca]|nr:hypothetical protein [Toensbergia leucococca]
MTRIEELPDDPVRSLNLNSEPSASDLPSQSLHALNQTPSHESATSPGLSPAAISQSTPFPLPPTSNSDGALTTTPPLPPQMASVKSHTVDEVVSMIHRTPLFMTSLDADTAADNPELDAMRALLYEGTRAEIAQGFRERGNEMAKAKKWADGKELYSKGLAALGVERKEGEANGEAEDRKEVEIEEACYINRALCNLELKNYRSTILDCASTLRLNPVNIKAHYRTSLAQISLQNLPAAILSTNEGLALSPQNGPLLALLAKITSLQASLAATERKRLDREARTKQEQLVLKAALIARGIRLRTTAQPPEMEDAAIRLVPDPVSPTSTLTFPVLLLYPEHGQSDFIKGVGEAETLGEHLGYLLPLPWDGKGEYTVKGVDGYMESAKGGLVKVGKKVELLRVLEGAGGVVADGVVRISVVPRGRAGAWVEEMKRRKGAAG